MDKKNMFSIFRFDGNLSSNTEKIRAILIALFGMMLPYDMFFTTLILYLLIATMLVDFKISKLKLIPKEVWIFIIVYFLSLIGYTYSTDTWRAGYVIERQLVIIIFPVLLPLCFSFDNVNMNFIFKMFSLSCIYTISYLLYHSFQVIYGLHLPLSYLFTSSFFNHKFTAPIGIHATYLSIYCSLAIFFLVDNLIKKSFLHKIVYLFGIVILLVGLFFLSSRTTTLGTIFIMIFIYPLFYIKRRAIFITISVISLIILAIIANRSSYLSNRFSSELAGDIRKTKEYSLSDPEPRIKRWECAFVLIKKKPLFGYGTGDEIGLLKEEYLKRQMMVSYKEEFNSHNQYIAFLIKNGLFGLLIFLAMMIYFFRLAIKSNDFVYLGFLTLLSISFFTENLLDANKGIFYFAFFNTLFGYKILFESKAKQTLPISFQE